ncbi:MAG: hypothetical protein ACIAQU_07240 [Phycisphaerales bacterium JB064]
MPMTGAGSNAILILVLAALGVVLFFAMMGAMGELFWVAQRLERCPHCGRCMSCGYELAGLEACPECGRGGISVRA